MGVLSVDVGRKVLWVQEWGCRDLECVSRSKFKKRCVSSRWSTFRRLIAKDDRHVGIFENMLRMNNGL